MLTNVDDLLERRHKIREFQIALSDLEETSSEYKNLEKQRVDNMLHIMVAVLPAILDLIDNGYTITELAR